MSTRSYQPGDSYEFGFTVKSSTGALTNADATPAGSLYHNGVVDSTVAVTVSGISAGVYKATCLIPTVGYAAGDTVELLITATIGGVATGEFVDHLRLVGWPNTALPNAAAGVANGLPTLDAATHLNVYTVSQPITAGTVTDKTGYSINLSQTGLTPRTLDAVADASLTVGDALVAAVAAAAGKESVTGTTYVVKTPSTGTIIRTFTLDSSTAPTQRN